MHRSIVVFALLAPLLSVSLGGSGCSCDGPEVNRTSGTLELGTGNLQFGRVCVGDTAIFNLEVRNDGNVPLHISGAVVVGSGVFAVESFPETLAAASNQAEAIGTIRVTFTPSGEGEFFADLVVSSDDLERPEVTARLSGSGDGGARVDFNFLCESASGASLEDCPATLSFGDVGVDLSKEIPLVIENAGCALLRVDSIVIQDIGGSGPAPGFSLTAPETPFNVTNVIQQTVVPTLTPTAADTYVGRLILDYTDAGNSTSDTASLSMVGTGVQLQLLVRPPSFNFAEADISTPQTQTFTIENTGGLAGEIVSIALETGDPEFTVTPPTTMPAPMAAFGTVEFDVTYTPVDAEPDQDAVLIVTGFGALNPVPVAGGPVPSIEVTPSTTIDFGTVPTAGTASQVVTIANVGQADLNVTGFNFTVNPSDVFSLASAPPLPQVVAPGASFDITVQFDDDPGIGRDANGAGQSEVGELAIANDDPAYATLGGEYLLFIDTDTQANHVPLANIRTFVAGTECFAQPCNLDVCAAGGAEVAAFDGTGSSDPDNDTLLYLWEITQVPTGGTETLSSTNAPTTQLAPTFPGRWTVRLTVEDPYGNTATALSELSVSRTGC
ncbi:MAG: choice-of-anchor D domain-containing protein [Deltaproteobacteria bacterium]|nr:choice-of-anchor D domain-containing protein [Deltaproteobacteria bacterium]